MRKLISKLILFTLPIFAVFAFPFYVLLVSGEFIPSGRVLSLQTAKAQPYMIVQAYSDDWDYIKLEGVRRVHPQVLALGTSRVMQVRSSYFKRSFYNAAKGMAEPRHLLRFLEQLPDEATPETILLGLDPNFFNSNWVWYSSRKLYQKPNDWKEWVTIFSKNWFAVYLDYFRGKFTLSEIREERKNGFRKVGLFARVEDSGFLNDGSFLYMKHILERRKGPVADALEKRRAAFENIRESRQVYVHGSEISKKTLLEIDAFLKEAKRRGIHVIAFLPPLAPSIYEEISARPEDFAYLSKIEAAAKPLFQKYGYSFFNFMDSRELGATDDYYVDDVHDTGEITLRLLMRIAENDEALARELVSDMEKYEQLGMIKTGLTEALSPEHSSLESGILNSRRSPLA